MLDERTHSDNNLVILVLGSPGTPPIPTKDMSRALTRGHIVVVSGNSSQFMVWSHGPDDALCLKISSSGRILSGYMPERFRRSALLISGTATPAMLAEAKASMLVLPDRAAAIREWRARADLTMPEADDRLRTRGHEFWNGDEIVPGCRWIAARTGGA